jgi:hypothetical protein
VNNRPYEHKVADLVNRYCGRIPPAYEAGVRSAFSVGEWGLAAAELASALVTEGVAVAPDDKILFRALLAKIEHSPDAPDHNEVGEVVSVEILFADGTLQFTAGESVSHVTSVSGSADSGSEKRLLAEVVRAAAESDRARMNQLHDEAFRTLGVAFIERRMSGVEFEAEFLKFWRLYRDSGVPTTSTVDELFADVDAFCGDPDLWEEGDLDEGGLLDAVRRFLRWPPVTLRSR